MLQNLRMLAKSIHFSRHNASSKNHPRLDFGVLPIFLLNIKSGESLAASHHLHINSKIISKESY